MFLFLAKVSCKKHTINADAAKSGLAKYLQEQHRCIFSGNKLQLLIGIVLNKERKRVIKQPGVTGMSTNT